MEQEAKKSTLMKYILYIIRTQKKSPDLLNQDF